MVMHGSRLSAVALAVVAMTGAHAQWTEFGGIGSAIDRLGAPSAPSPARGRAFYVTPYATISETLTDNADLRATNPQWDAITQATVGVNVGGTYGSLSGSLSYGLTGVFYANGTGENDVYVSGVNDLLASGTIEAVEDRVFVDLFASIQQQVIDPFGVRPADPGIPSENTATTVDYGISPYARGTIGGSVDYFARLNFTGSANSASSVYGFQDFSGSGRLQGSTRFARLGWALTVAGRASAYGDELRTGNYGGAASLIYAVTSYLTVRANAGIEFQNYLDADATQRSDIYGGGFDWQPTDRTTVSGFYERRFFGDSYFASAQHRTPRTVWTYRGRQGISEITGVSPVSFGTNFDLFFQQFASIEPDPVKREQLVREFLRRNGIPAGQQLTVGFLTTQIQLERSHELSFAWLIGRRNTLTISVGQSDTSALVDFLDADNGFDSDSFVRSRNLGASFSRQLTPRSSVSVFGGRTQTEDRDGGRATTQDSVFVNWGTDLSSRSRFDVTARRVRFDSPTDPYTENAVVASYYISF
jgi:uncharacterized protein (PEP-CTERM system associated)